MTEKEGLDDMFLTDTQVADLFRAIDVLCDVLEADSLSGKEFDSFYDAFDEITDGKITYNQFIHKTGLDELKKLLLM